MLKENFYREVGVNNKSFTNFESNLLFLNSSMFKEISNKHGFMFRDLNLAYGIQSSFRITFPSMALLERILNLTKDLKLNNMIKKIGN